jgi:intergrase/recombinase
LCNIQLTFLKASNRLGIKITPQTLREWFCSEMGRLGVPDRYVDAFCGRVPNSVLARHYTDFSPERLKEIYEKVGLKIL